MAGTGGGAARLRPVADAVVVGSGPNGLAAALTLSRAGWQVEVVEAADEPGGGLRTAELIEAGVVHDLCSETHPLAVASHFFTREWNLTARVEMVHPAVPFAHALDGGRFAVAHRGLDATAERLAGAGGRAAAADAEAYAALLRPFVDHSPDLAALFTSRLRGVPLRGGGPAVVAALARLVPQGLPAVLRRFSGPEGPALLAGNAAHAIRPLGGLAPAAVAYLLTALAHTSGWPLARGGSGSIARAMVDDLRARGGHVHTGRRVTSLADLPAAPVVLLDLGPRQLLGLLAPPAAGAGSPAARWYRWWLRRHRYGPGACTVHYVTSEPVPWLDADARRAGTVHVGGTWAEVAAAEAAVAAGRHAARPFTLVGQPTVADPTRATPGRHVVWAYCHVPPGSGLDAEQRITAQIERFAPGFRDTVVGTAVRTAAGLEAENPVHVGGDIAVGVASTLGIALRPVPRWDAYRTPLPGVYVCGAAAPPGPGVHGMAGYWAARAALADRARRR